ncbi:helix-turn-helix domain-containing protein [Intrasporangium sp.]|uniref:helix-turn-helix transcriptional regulator n=1 Tax=Intrasporangium sp. TaxID=1925024 RepID=UPI0032217604
MQNTEGWGPAPTRDGTADLVAGLSAQRRRVFEALGDQPRPIGSIAGSLGLHVNTAREHLDGLVAAGLAVRTRLAPKGRGRPGWGYAARPAVTSAAGEYATLARVLADHVAAQGGDVRGDMRRLGRGWGRALVEDLPAATAPGGADRQVVELLARLGFAPDGAPEGCLHLRECPMLAVARERPDVVCSVHHGMVEGALEAAGGDPDGVRLEAFAEIGACRLHLH